MKRIFATALILCLMLSLTGCSGLKYTLASWHYRVGHYEKAYTLYSDLEDYADSPAMTQISRQKADYAAAQAHYEAGEYRQAMELYNALGLYMDCPVKAAESQYALGLSLMEQKDYGEAIAQLSALGNYKDSIRQTGNAVVLCLTEALEGTEGICLELDNAQLSLMISGADSVDLVYENSGLLLGVPHKSSFTITLFPATRTANFSAIYFSTATRIIDEDAAGTIDPAHYGVDRGLTTTAFTQTITEPDGTKTVITDTTEAIIVQSLLPEAAAAITEHLDDLLALTGTDITAKHLGFLSLN